MFKQIEEQCGWIEILETKNIEGTSLFPSDNNNVSFRSRRKVDKLLSGDNMHDFDNYENLVHASILLPIVMIFIKSVTIETIANPLKGNSVHILLMLIVLISFGFIVMSIFNARETKRYKVKNISYALLTLFASAYCFLYADLDALWNIFYPTLFIALVLITLTLSMEKCDRCEYVCIDGAIISILVFLIFSLYFLCLDNYSFIKDFTFAVPFLMYIFYFSIIYLHDKYLELTEYNNENIDELRRLFGFLDDISPLNADLNASYVNRSQFV